MFEQMLMQVVLNSTGPVAEVAGDAFVNSITSIMGSFTALVIAIASIIPAFIAIRSAGRNKTKQEEQAEAMAEAIQVVMQKVQEETATKAQMAKGLFQFATTDEQRQKLDAEISPIINSANESVKAIDRQIPAIKGILGVKTADINAKTDFPRESESALRTINKAVDEAKAS